jgi:hypothetical protein
MMLSDQRDKKEKEVEILKKKKYLSEIMHELNLRQRKIEDEIRRIKADEDLKEKQIREANVIKEEIIKKMREKYEQVRNNTNFIHEFETDNKRHLWNSKRNKNRNLRYELFNQMCDEISFPQIFPSEFITKEKPNNYHQRSQNIIVSDEDIIIEIPNKIETELPVVLPMQPSILPIEKEIFPKFFIKNIIYNDFVTPIIETAMEFADANIIKQQKIQTELEEIKKQNKIIDKEAFELLNQIQVLINENSDQKRLFEFPIHIILQEFCYDIIIRQYKFVSSCFYVLLKNKFELKKHMEFIHDFYLGYKGDVILNMVEYMVDFQSN